jgi:hypothetical protein
LVFSFAHAFLGASDALYADFSPASADVYGIHLLRRTKASLIYCRTKNLPAVQLLPGRAGLGGAEGVEPLTSALRIRSPVSNYLF